MIAPARFRVVTFAVGDLGEIARFQLEDPDLLEFVMHPADAILLVTQAADDFDGGFGNAGGGSAVIGGAHRRPTHTDELAAVGRPIEPGHGHAVGREDCFEVVFDFDYAKGIAFCVAVRISQAAAVAAPGDGSDLAVAIGETAGGIAAQIVQIKLGDVAVGGTVGPADGVGDLRGVGGDGDFGEPAELHQVFGDEPAAAVDWRAVALIHEIVLEKPEIIRCEDCTVCAALVQILLGMGDLIGRVDTDRRSPLQNSRVGGIVGDSQSRPYRLRGMEGGVYWTRGHGGFRACRRRRYRQPIHAVGRRSRGKRGCRFAPVRTCGGIRLRPAT